MNNNRGISSRFTRSWIIAVIALLGTAAVGYSIFWSTSQEPDDRQQVDVSTEPAPSILLVSPNTYDFGSVSVQYGEASTSFKIRNAGEGEIVLKDMDTSCGCTEATIVVDGVEGPRFNMRMHGQDPTGWSVRLAPGEEAQLRVYYDPMTHPDLRGPVTREVYLFGDDLRKPLSTVRILVNQTS